MQSDTDCLPQLDEEDFIDTIVLDEDDVMATREMRQLLDPGAAASEDEEPDDDAS